MIAQQALEGPYQVADDALLERDNRDDHLAVRFDNQQDDLLVNILAVDVSAEVEQKVEEELATMGPRDESKLENLENSLLRDYIQAKVLWFLKAMFYQSVVLSVDSFL